jgi:hypothetical protein
MTRTSHRPTHWRHAPRHVCVRQYVAMLSTRQQKKHLRVAHWSDTSCTCPITGHDSGTGVGASETIVLLHRHTIQCSQCGYRLS